MNREPRTFGEIQRVRNDNLVALTVGRGDIDSISTDLIPKSAAWWRFAGRQGIRSVEMLSMSPTKSWFPVLCHTTTTLARARHPHDMLWLVEMFIIVSQDSHVAH